MKEISIKFHTLRCVDIWELVDCSNDHAHISLNNFKLNSFCESLVNVRYLWFIDSHFFLFLHGKALFGDETNSRRHKRWTKTCY